MILSFVNKKVDHAFPLGLSHLSSLLPFLNYKKGGKKQQKQVTKKFSEEKQVHVGMEASKTNQTRWE